jgi:biopolymer transport protein ExbD
MQTVGESQYKSTRMWFTILICFGVFLLLVGGFYLYTITASSPTAMKLFLPKDSGSVDEKKLPKGPGSLTLILGKNNIIYYYEGELAKDGANMKATNFNEIRNVIVKKKEVTREEDFFVIIKPAGAATYTNTVDILDEMTRNDVKRYSMVDISPVEESMIRRR